MCKISFMFECFKHNIHLLYLPSHTSHILQPLDLGIFSPLKTSYRKWAHRLFIQTDTSAIGKSGFLCCLYKARCEALTEHNVKAGLRAAGLWPVNPRKPLRSDQLLPQPSQEANGEANGKTNGEANGGVNGKANQRAAQVFNTPKKSADIDTLLQRPGSSPISPSSMQLAVNKIKKGYDKYIFDLAHQKARNEELEAKIQQLRPKKKKLLLSLIQMTNL